MITLHRTRPTEPTPLRCDAQVLVSFDGWSSEYDEWLPKGSERLAAHRGWGTSRMPDDLQRHAIIEALDMEGRWYRAKVMRQK